jgi:cholesterol oxidase
MRAANSANLRDPQLAEIAVTFAGAAGVKPGAPIVGKNLHRRPRRTCTLSGDCDLGCNEGAKNSLDFNYLTDFDAAGGRIWTCCEAIDIAQGDDGVYEVRFLQHRTAREDVLARARAEGKEVDDRRLLHPDPELLSGRIRARVVVLAAGTLGSTRLLLASRTKLPRLSHQLGQRFSSNGDLLLFARNCVDPQSGHPRDLAPSRGPTITAYATGGAAGEEFWVEDAGGPVGSEWGWQATEAAGDTVRLLRTDGRHLLGLLCGRDGDTLASRELAHALGSARASAAMLPLLGMGHDVPGGRIGLARDGLSLDWDPAGSTAHFERVEHAAAAVAEQLGGRLWPGPAWLRRRLRGTTVHPLGGCPMAIRAKDGVVDGRGEVFGYPGLFVADGSVIPGPVGPNPSLTIASIADHVAGQAVDKL